MLSNEKKNEIISKINQKKISPKYQKSIIKYIELNIELFGFLDVEELINRIVENFGGVSPNITSFLYNDYGQYTPTTGKVLLSPKLYWGKNRKYKESVFLHELDHCACSPITVKQQYNKYKSEIKKKHKYFYKLIPDFISSEIFLKIHYEGPISGIANLKRERGYILQKITYGTKLENYLNEGITSLKQKIYSDKLNLSFHKKKDFFYGVRMGAECIGKVIGFDNLIYLHFNNNLKNIEEDFFGKTNIKLEELILKCIEYDKKNTKKRLKQLKLFIEQIYKKVNCA